jgi:tRNA(adenine34) deaminase
MKKTNPNYMQAALKEARKAQKKNEPPIGAVLVKDDKIIAKGHNLRESSHDPTNHAEMICIRKACRKLKSWRLEKTALYVTLKPCKMCREAIKQSRIEIVYYGAKNLKKINYKTKFHGGLMKQECGKILTDFFKGLRNK